MANEIKLSGIVLSAAPMGDKDLRLNVLTRESGCLSVLAKGALGPKSKWRSVSQPFSLVHMVLTRGQTFYYIKEAELADSLYALRADLDRLSWGSLMLEVAGDFSVDGADNRALVNLLARGLMAIAGNSEADPSALAGAFLWRLLSDNGYRADLRHCRSCGLALNGAGPWGFLPEEGGVLCPACERLHPASYRPDPATLRLMIRLQEAPEKEVYLQSEEGADRAELTRVAIGYLQYHSGRHYRALEFIRSMEK